MDSLREEKVKKFEEFVDCRLKPDLVHAIAERDKVFEQQKMFLDLKRNIENLESNGVTHLRTLVNLGSEVYMQADVPDSCRIFVDIGLGFHVELTWTEALEFISVKEARLARYVKVFGSYSRFRPCDIAESSILQQHRPLHPPSWVLPCAMSHFIEQTWIYRVVIVLLNATISIIVCLWISKLLTLICSHCQLMVKFSL